MATSAPVWEEREVRVIDLKPYERNPRIMTKEAFNKLKASLKENGYHQRIVAQPDLSVIGGHQRIRALNELGIEKIKVLVPDRQLSLEEFRRILVQDNLPFGDFDFEILSADFERDELEDWGMPNWMLDDFGDAGSEGETDPDATPGLEANVITKEGDVWLLGSHRVACGDCRHADIVNALLGDRKPPLMVTDPPYGVEYDSEWREKAMPEKNTSAGARGKVENDDESDWREAWHLSPAEIAYVWHAGSKAHIVADSLSASGFDLRAQIIWVKNQFVIGRGHYHTGHEPCWYAVRRKGQAHWTGDRKQSTVWQIDKQLKNESGHSTQKPVECMQRPLINHTRKGDLVYDPFLGSGTTVIAAQRTGRVCLGIELNPAYVDVTIRRWEQFTGQKATLERTGEAFDDLASVPRETKPE